MIPIRTERIASVIRIDKVDGETPRLPLLCLKPLLLRQGRGVRGCPKAILARVASDIQTADQIEELCGGSPDQLRKARSTFQTESLIGSVRGHSDKVRCHQAAALSCGARSGLLSLKNSHIHAG